MKPPLKPTRAIVYIVGMLLLLTATGLLGLLSVNAGVYVLAQLLALGLGILHLYLLYRFVPSLNVNRLVPGLLVTVLLMLAGVIAIMVAYRFVFPTGNYAFSACLIPFVIPYVFAWVYQYYLSIPVAEYKKWYYPMGKPMPDLDLIDLSKILVIQFEFTKKLTDAAPTNFKAKAPVQMTLGELFLIFLNDYNEQNAASNIQFMDEKNTSLGWHFYRKKGMFSSRHYFDPDLNFGQNSIADNLIITAERS